MKKFSIFSVILSLALSILMMTTTVSAATYSHTHVYTTTRTSTIVNADMGTHTWQTVDNYKCSCGHSYSVIVSTYAESHSYVYTYLGTTIDGNGNTIDTYSATCTVCGYSTTVSH